MVHDERKKKNTAMQINTQTIIQTNFASKNVAVLHGNVIIKPGTYSGVADPKPINSFSYVGCCGDTPRCVCQAPSPELSSVT